MTKLVVLFIATFCAVATAQPAPGTGSASGARQACVEAMNADPEFARAIVATVDKQLDQRTIDTHVAAANQVAENQRHVLFAYAAMWLIAVIFVVFMWRRQQALKAELVLLRKDLESAAKEPA